MGISQADIDALMSSDDPQPASAATEVAPAATPIPAPPAPPRAKPNQREVSRILKLSVPVIVVLAEREMTVESILQITVGTIIEFDVPFDAEFPLRVSNQTIGRGQAVKVGENFGLRVTRIDSVSHRIDALGNG